MTVANLPTISILATLVKFFTSSFPDINYG